MFEAVILDLDGLLVDSEHWQIEAWNRYLRRFEVQLDEFEAARLLDQRDYDNAEYIRRRYDLSEDPLTIQETRQEIFMKLAEENIELMPGVNETLQLLKENGFRLAVVSAGVRDYIYLMMDKFGWDEVFDVIVAGDMIDASKPNPMPFLACAETFALHPSHCLVLDDSRDGVEAALNAGMQVICVPGPTTDRWRITGADVVLVSLDYLNLPTIRSIWRDHEDLPQPQLQPHLSPQPRRGRW
jgi:HAD superfamily hydrolase (TIGR01509 family)